MYMHYTVYMSTRTSGGYIGILSLLISVLIIGFLFWRMDLFSGSSTTKGVSPIQQDLGAIKAAERAKQLIERSDRQQTAGLEN